MPMNLCPVDLVGACWANGQRRRIVQLESILNVSQLAIRAPASPGSTAAILLFSLSLSDSAARRPHPNLTRLGRSDTLFPIFRCLHMDGPLGRLCIRWYVIVKPIRNQYIALSLFLCCQSQKFNYIQCDHKKLPHVISVQPKSDHSTK